MRLNRALPLGAALVLALFAWGPGSDTRFGGGFPAHMTTHMLLVTGVAPALALALPDSWARFAPAALAGAVIEFLVVWGWHLPAFHQRARFEGAWFLLEQGSFLLAGLAVWVGAFRASHPLVGAGALLLTSMHMTLLGALLVLGQRAVYGPLCGDSLTDQQLGGLIMLGTGTPIYLVAGLWLTARALADRQPEGQA